MNELDSYMDSGQIGGDKNHYNYVALAVDPLTAVGFSRKGVIIEYDGDGVRANGRMVEYTGRPVPTGQSTNINRAEKIGKPMSVVYAHEREVRVRENTGLNKIGIKRIYISPSVLSQGKYSSNMYKKLGKIEITDSVSKKWIIG